jgi:hypothetical protein
MKNIKIKKLFALVTVVFFTLSLLPIVQATDAAYKENENVVAHRMNTEELFAYFGQTYVPDEFLSINDDISVDDFTIPDNFPELITDEYLINACFPGYFTPDYVTLQDVPSRNSGQGSRSNPQPVKTIIMVDTEAYDKYAAMARYAGYTPTDAGCYAWANNILEGGDDMMELWFGIDFQGQPQQFIIWDSPNYMNYYQLLSTIAQVSPTVVGCDVVVLMTGQSGGTLNGVANPYPYGEHFVMSVSPVFDPLVNLFQHEASHLFGCHDHDPGLTTYCIMSYTWCSVARDYCKSGDNCFNIMMTNRDHFD